MGTGQLRGPAVSDTREAGDRCPGPDEATRTIADPPSGSVANKASRADTNKIPRGDSHDETIRYTRALRLADGPSAYCTTHRSTRTNQGRTSAPSINFHRADPAPTGRNG